MNRPKLHRGEYRWARGESSMYEAVLSPYQTTVLLTAAHCGLWSHLSGWRGCPSARFGCVSLRLLVLHPPCRRSPDVCTTYMCPVCASYSSTWPSSLGRRAWRAVCGSRLRSLEPCAREPTSPTYIDAIQARRHPSLAHEACLVWCVCLTTCRI